jgi:hypothetical protein
MHGYTLMADMLKGCEWNHNGKILAIFGEKPVLRFPEISNNKIYNALYCWLIEVAEAGDSDRTVHSPNL